MPLSPLHLNVVMRVGDVPMVPYYRPGDTRLGEASAKLAPQYRVFLLANHGPIVVGENLREAADNMEELEETARLIFTLGCPSIHVMAGMVPVGADRKNYLQVFIDNVRYATDRFAEHNINVMIEALNPKIKPNYLFSSQYQTLELVNLINRPNVFTQLNLFHVQIVDGNLSHLITAFAGRYGYIQIASVPVRHEPDEGEINYTDLFGLLDEINYKGWIGCEYHPRAGTAAGLNWIYHKY